MNFDLSDEQLLLQETLAKFLEKQCPPIRVRELFDSDDPFDEELWQGLTELGVGGLILPEEYGGSDLELLDAAVMAETLGYHATPGPFFEHILASLSVLLGGSEAQKQEWLPKLATGAARGSVAFAEGKSWQPEEWTLNIADSLHGTKDYVPFAAGADLIVVGVCHGGLALVHGAAKGLRIETLHGVDRTRRIDRVHFEGSPCERLPQGAAASQRVRDAGLILLAADAFGGGLRCVEMAVEYAKTREQFGVTIGHFQAVKHQLATMALEIEPARGLYWYAAHAFDHAVEESALSAALAKSHLTERFLQVARDTVETHGGIGYTWECDVQFWLKRALFDRAMLGVPATHRQRVADLSGW